jgi:hypothetical protein
VIEPEKETARQRRPVSELSPVLLIAPVSFRSLFRKRKRPHVSPELSADSMIEPVSLRRIFHRRKRSRQTGDYFVG